MVLCGSIACCAAPPPPLPTDAALSDDLRKTLGERFSIRETDHFTIAYDTPHDTLRSLTGRLEGTYSAVWTFCEHLDIPLSPPEQRLTVVLLDRHEDFAEYCRTARVRVASAAGFYDGLTNRSIFLNMMNSPEVMQLNDQIHRHKQQIANGDRALADTLQAHVSAIETRRDALVKRFNKLIIQHEAAHQVLFNIGIHVRGADNPIWLTEGLACQFEVPQSEIARGKVQINHMRLGDFREALGVGPQIQRLEAAVLQAAIAERRLLSFADFVRDGQVAENDPQRVSFRYAQCWAMVYYLVREHRDAFGRYIQKLAHREPGRIVIAAEKQAEFEEEFGALAADFDERWVSFMLKLRFDPKEAG